MVLVERSDMLVVMEPQHGAQKGATVMGAGAGTEAGTGAGTGKGSVRLFMISSFMFLSSRMSLHILQESGG